MTPRRVLVIGLDGATLRLLEPWAAAGELPALARLMAAGCHGELRSTFPPLTPPAWSSFMTGKNPGKHGVFGFRQPASAGYASGSLITARDIRARTLWDIVGDAGRQVGVVSMPPSYPVRPVNGFMVACMMAPKGEAVPTHPPELAALLGEGYEITVEPVDSLLASNARYGEAALAYLRHLRRITERQLGVHLRLLHERPWDLLAVVLYEHDKIQHFFWRHVTGDVPPWVDRAVADEIVSEARAIYRLVDDTIGALVAAAGPETVTLLVSDHGFGPAPTRLVHVNRWLAGRGWLHARGGWRWRRKLVKRLPQRLRPRFDTVEHIFVDWGRSRAWCEVLETRSAGVWLNVEGRQPRGRVRPGPEYEALRQEIRRALAALREDGKPVFETVALREEIYRGPHAALAPDLLLYAAPAHGFSFAGLRAEMHGREVFTATDYAYTGAHHPAGLYVAAGPGIARNGRTAPAPIEACAPTILCLLGLPVPDGMDAAPLVELLTPAARAALPVRHVPDADAAPAGGEGWQSDADRAQVEARLRALGYVE